MNPKNGTAIAADLPEAPDEAEEATTADPGEKSRREDGQATGSQK